MNSNKRQIGNFGDPFAISGGSMITDDSFFLPESEVIVNDSLLESPDESQSDSSSGADILSKLIMESEVYKQAYDILSSDKSYGAPFLRMLQMVPYSHDLRDKNFWDNVVDFFGGTSGFDNAITDAFNKAIDEIRAIMQEYYAFKSSLPSEQVSQLQEAGINAAITGQGVDGAQVSSPDPSSLISADNPQSEYSNTQISDGITSFVEFIGSMANLAGLGVNSQNILGLLDIAERESYNKQQTHDLLLAGLGVTTDSPYRVLSSSNTPVISDIAKAGVSSAKIDSVEKGSQVKALESPITVNVGDDPNNVANFEVKSGSDWLTEVSRFQIANRFANVMITNLQNQGKQLYAGALSYLEGEYNAANFGALTNEARFNQDYFSSRNGSLEGKSQTSIQESFAFIRDCEANIRSVEDWLSEYRAATIENWGQQLQRRPSLAPYFYKAMFDFNMEDTFYHQNAAAQAFKYGQDALNSIGSFISHLTGFRSPKMSPRKVGQTTLTSGPKGQTTSETIMHYE